MDKEEAGPELEEGEQFSELRQFRELIERAAQALGVDSTISQAHAPSGFDDGCETQPAPSLVPLLSDVEELMQASFARPTDPLKFSQSYHAG